MDFSADVADTVPVFALAAGAKLAYVAQEAPSPSARAWSCEPIPPSARWPISRASVLPSPKAAGVHYLIIALLEKSGLSFKDIEPAYLTPADGRAAFERGSVDAWVVWDAFLAAVQRQSNVRVIADGKGVASYQRYYLASLDFINKRSPIASTLFEELKKTGRWVKQNPRGSGRSPGAGLGAGCGDRRGRQRPAQLRRAPGGRRNAA